VICPYCEAHHTISLEGAGTGKWVWPHPMEGKHRNKWAKMDYAWYSRIFGPLGSPGELEKSFHCPHFEKDFHVKVFTEKPDRDMREYFRAEDLRLPPSTIIDNALAWVPLPYPVSCLLFALAIWLIWALPVTLSPRDGIPRLVTDIESLWMIPSTAVLILSIKYCSDRVRNFEKQFCKLAKVRQCFREWTYYRYAYYVLGRPNPPVASPPTLAGIVAALVFFPSEVVWCFIFSESVVTPVSAATWLMAWTVIAFIFGMALWIAIATAWTVNRIGARLVLKYDPLDRTAGVKGLADLAVASLLPLVTGEIEMVVFFLFLANPQQSSVPAEIVSIVGYVSIILGTTIVVGLFLVAVYSVHQGMSDWKIAYLSALSERYERISRFPEGRMPVTEEERVEASSILSHYDRVSSIREWPYDLGILSRVVAIAASVAITIGVEEFFPIIESYVKGFLS
jgi:hypothetical protein